MDHLILERRPDLVLINEKKKKKEKKEERKEKKRKKRKKEIMLSSGGPPSKNKRKRKKKKCSDFARELKKLLNMRVTVIPVVFGALGTVSKGLEKGTGINENQRKNRDHTNYSIVEIGQNTEKSPLDLRRLVVIQTTVKDHQLRLVQKSHKE